MTTVEESPAAAGHGTPFLEIAGLSKSYPGVKAVQKVDLTFVAGETVGLVGKNGAGKSTLIKMIAAAVRPDEGTMHLDGQLLDLHQPVQATQAGLAFVHQDLYDVPDLSVAENVMLGLGFPRRFGGLIDWPELYRQARAVIHDLEVDIDPKTPVGGLSVAKQRLVMIARGLAQKARLLVLDEPSASLTDEEIDHLFAVVRRLRQRGIAVIYVSHRLEEIFELTERVVVMRDGRVVADERTEELDRRSLITHITGQENAQSARERRESRGIGGRPDTEVVLEVTDIATNTGVEGCSFDLRAGEILGLGGLVGAGRTELVRAIFGADRHTRGTIAVRGRQVKIASPVDAMHAGLALLPEDRKTQGNVMDFSIRHNITLASLPKHRLMPKVAAPSRASERREAHRIIERLDVATPTDTKEVRLLSGGNQQKVVIGRWMSQGADILIFDEPTHGVDVGGKDEIYEVIEELAAQGKAIILISSEFNELVGVCHRVVAMHEGRFVGEVEGDAVTEQAIIELCYGHTTDA